MPDLCETWGELFPNPLKYLQDNVHYSKTYPGLPNGRILRSIIQRPNLGAPLPRPHLHTGCSCSPPGHVGSKQLSSRRWASLTTWPYLGNQYSFSSHKGRNLKYERIREQNGFGVERSCRRWQNTSLEVPVWGGNVSSKCLLVRY